MRKNDNIAELNSEALSEQEMNAYLSMMTEDTPDLWDRIEEGFAKETENVTNHEDNKVTPITARKIKIKYIGIIAACLLAVVIAIPVLSGVIGGGKKSDNFFSKNDEIACGTTAAVVQEDTAISGEASNDLVTDSDLGAAGDEGIFFEATESCNTVEAAGDANGMQGAEESAAEPVDKAVEKYIIVDDAVYVYDGVYINALPDGYTIIGTVQAIDGDDPDENFEGMGLADGLNIYGNSSEEDIIYIEVHENGYEKFIKK
ncbi:MAG: hypothetical protein NC393_05795 [Clostridium sp.]|nr:hypothetical protein [Clostridium sp.]MCM1171626.1 hypothetical protein [Clostridium sp.]MCM1207885.1 hypothetical protein [Ruminococcus sp.]